MSWTRGMMASGLLGLLALSAQAQTTQTFDGDGTPYVAANFGGTPGAVTPGGPSGNFYRLAYDGVGGTLNSIYFDTTDPGPISHVVLDVDFKIGRPGSSGGFADGIGIQLLNTDLFGTTGPGPAISEEPAANQSLGLGLDIFNNGGPIDISNNEVSVDYTQYGPGFIQVFNVAYDLNVIGPPGYTLHNDVLFDSDPFDHLHMTVDIGASGATVNVTITSVFQGLGTFPVVNNLLVPGVAPYPMRVAFGARTGGATDNHDIDNVSVTFLP